MKHDVINNDISLFDGYKAERTLGLLEEKKQGAYNFFKNVMTFIIALVLGLSFIYVFVDSLMILLDIFKDANASDFMGVVVFVVQNVFSFFVPFGFICLYFGSYKKSEKIFLTGVKAFKINLYIILAGLALLAFYYLLTFITAVFTFSVSVIFSLIISVLLLALALWILLKFIGFVDDIRFGMENIKINFPSAIVLRTILIFILIFLGLVYLYVRLVGIPYLVDLGLNVDFEIYVMSNIYIAAMIELLYMIVYSVRYDNHMTEFNIEFRRKMQKNQG